MFRIRFHGRGGQGMKTAANLLSRAFFLEGYEIQDAPRYGSERRGAPIFAYVRAAKEPILERGAITRPDLILVADDSLIHNPSAGVLQNVNSQTILLIHSEVPGAEWKERLQFPGTVIGLPISAVAKSGAQIPVVSASCTGAAAGLVGVIHRETLEPALREELTRLGESVIAQNLETALAAFDAMQPFAGCVQEGGALSAEDYAPPDWIEIPYEDSTISAPIIYRTATSEQIQTGFWRTRRPLIDYSHCNRCSWVCSTFCPDSAIHVDPDRTPHIDYEHCKGCMICLAVCPPHAIHMEKEPSAPIEGAAR
jgi:pyruvate ferredoxin oxidoreductase gamma subunit